MLMSMIARYLLFNFMIPSGYMKMFHVSKKTNFFLQKKLFNHFFFTNIGEKICYVSQTYVLNVHYVLASYATTKKVTFVTNVSVLKFDLLLYLSSVVKNVLCSSLDNEITKQEPNRDCTIIQEEIFVPNILFDDDKIERIDRTKLYYICNI